MIYNEIRDKLVYIFELITENRVSCQGLKADCPMCEMTISSTSKIGIENIIGDGL